MLTKTSKALGFFLGFAALSCWFAWPATAQDGSKVFKLDAESNQYRDQQTVPGYGYPAPKMIPQKPKAAPPPPPPKHPKPLKAAVQQVQAAPPPPQRPPLQAHVEKQQALPPGVLPNQFLGTWLVMGQLKNVKARPEFQSGIQNIFTASNSQTWSINGQPGSYSMSADTGVQQLQVGNCLANTAFIRYQHQIGHTVAQEAIVMQLSPDGRTFQGMERISIVKPGEAGGPRAVVQYNLIGQRR